MTLMQKAFLNAVLEYGTAEIVGAGSNKRVLTYLEACNLPDQLQSTDETAWCSAFMNFCVQKAGGSGTKSAMARSWLNWGKPTDSPKKGDIVVFKRGNDGVSGHVAFLILEGTKYVYVYGGNQSNKVKVSRYAKSDVLGYRRSLDAE